MSGSNEISRRDFIKVTTGIVGGLIGVAIGLPTISYLIDMQVGIPYPFSFTRVQVNGWERTSNSFGGYAVRKSDDPKDILILNSRCTHLGCSVNWSVEAKAYTCPCHDAKFGLDGQVLDGPPPRPLDVYSEFRLTEDGRIEIFSKAG
jgi:menaquinol-cytochrome c reductase iron-sulfur subunit